MNALTDIAPEIKFRERMRGYDPSEVDRYVKSAVHQAAQADERIRELEFRLAQAHSEAEASRADGDSEIRETMLRTLVLAQRTADTAISEARSEALSIINSAQEKASQTLLEAEATANEMMRSAEDHASSVLAESESRVIEIDARLDSERDTLRRLATSFHSFVQEFEQATSLNESGSESFDSRSVTSINKAGEALSGEAVAEAGSPDERNETDAFVVDAADTSDFESRASSVAGLETDYADTGPPTMPFELDMSELLDGEIAGDHPQESDDGFIEQLRQVVTSDAPQAGADAALAAFFGPENKANSDRETSERNGKLGSRA